MKDNIGSFVLQICSVRSILSISNETALHFLFLTLLTPILHYIECQTALASALARIIASRSLQTNFQVC